tara:strand:- start:54 stop:995 length:942 start_codon:yes stop_codon:yes gene_type:complete
MTEKTCYISVFYLGDRRINQKEIGKQFGYSLILKDRFECLNKQITYLSKIEHNLNKIFFVFNLDLEHLAYINTINDIVPKKIQGTPVEIIFRENKGFSYGAWNDVFEQNRNNFDYFIFNEDDYVFVKDNFDKYLINKFNSYPDAGYICPFVKEGVAAHNYRKHTAHSAGISSKEALNKIWDKNGYLIKYKDSPKYYIHGEILQLNWGYMFIQNGFNIYDIRDDFRVAFSMTEPDKPHLWKLWWWNEEDLILPTNALFLNDVNPRTNYPWWSSWDVQYQQNFKNTTLKQTYELEKNEQSYLSLFFLKEEPNPTK